MPDLTPAGRKALAYWGEIEFAARERLTTADLWASLQDAAERLGLSSPGITVQGISNLRAFAGSIQRAEQRFERARDTENIAGHHIGDAPWARSLPEQNALNIFQVRYQHTFLQDGEEQTEWRTSVFTGRMPGTVGELRAAISEDANELARKYGVEHVDFGAVQILRV